MDGPIFVIGYPHAVGGANTECWHTIKLWRSLGIDVHLIPTWEASQEWRDRCDAIGCVTHNATVDTLGDIPGLRGATAVSFCNGAYWASHDRWEALGVRCVWVNCMTTVFPFERAVGKPAAAYVFQSEYQRKCIEPELSGWGYRPEIGRLIRGAFCVEDFPFTLLPHARQSEFRIGRISRAAADKFSRDTWKVYDAINYRPLRATVVGYDEKVNHKLGDPPCFAEVHPAGIMSAQDFYANIHCLVHLTGGSRENWPRCGLEAMASGVPIVAEMNYGWPEMIEHRRTGFLGRGFHDYAHWAAVLAHDEEKRFDVAWLARKRVMELCDPAVIGPQWIELFKSLAVKDSTLCASV